MPSALPPAPAYHALAPNTLSDHEERLRRVEAALRALARPDAPPATPRVAPRPVPVPPADPTRFTTLGRALAGTAHDLNNLLAVVHGYAELLAGELAGDPRQEAATVLRSAAELAGGVVRHLLAVARPDPAAPARTPVGEHLAGLERLLRAVVAGGPGRVTLAVEHGCGGAAARLAPAELTQIVLNLAVNAREAMPGGGELVVRTAAVEAGPDAAGGPPASDWVAVGVSDTGRGLPAAVRERLADPAGLARADAGGLGLMTVADILARRGGHLRAAPAGGPGTSVWVYLPRG
jgi:two-component system cell cycle sensor histidine kinase/response regulator CckA